MKPKIYVFVNSGQGTDWQCALAMAEDGEVLAGHVCSSRGWVRSDMGLDGSSSIAAAKLAAYARHYPDGYELIDVPDEEVATHPGLSEAYRRNQERKPT